MLRPGRIDRIVYVGLPDNEARKHIINLHLSKIPANEIDLDVLVSKVGRTPVPKYTHTNFKQTERYSGAEVVAVCREASMFALTESIDIEFVTMRHFQKALDKVKPRISDEMITFYRNFQQSTKLG